MFVGKPDGKRSLLRPRHMWEEISYFSLKNSVVRALTEVM
jgi:hypothetical protein